MTVETYALSFVDILGQKAKLEQLNDNSLNKKEIQKIFKETFGAVKEFRNCFTSTFEIIEKKSISSEKKYSSNQLKTDSFSDLMTNYVSLRNDINLLPLKGIYSLMLATGGTFLQMLSIGIPVRGAIEVGKGIIHTLNGHDELYGSALSEAYSLESKAEYPRIIIGKFLYEHVEIIASDIATSDTDKINQKYAIKCLDMISTDYDGCYILNYLSSAFPSDGVIYRKAISTINNEIIIAKSEKNKKLENRYNQLKTFFEEGEQANTKARDDD